MMKPFTISAALIISIAVLSSTTSNPPALAQEGKKPQDTYVLGPEAKLGGVTFSHIKHITENRNLEGTGPSACTECHHTAQPASEAAKHPPLKTAYPADRTTSLTMELAAKDANAVGALCRDCHAKVDTKPKLLPEIPQIKFETGTELISLTNQQAYHRNCAGCHDEVVRVRPNVAAPTSKKCTTCHKKTAA